jgi:hypothetical protein
MARCRIVSFDLTVWALRDGTSTADVQAAHERCRRGEHATGGRQPRITAFYRELTAAYPDRQTGGESPWAVSPLHVAGDHVEMRLHASCDDEVLLTIERLAGEHGLLLLDPQHGAVYPPPSRVG